MKKSFLNLKTAPMGPFSLVCISMVADSSNLAPKRITSIKMEVSEVKNGPGARNMGYLGHAPSEAISAHL